MTNSSSFIYVFIALFVGVGLGFIIGRGRKATTVSAPESLANLETQLAVAQSQVEMLTNQLTLERDNSSKNVQIQAEVAALKENLAALARSSSEADTRRTEAETALRVQVENMNANNGQLVAQTKTIASVLNSSQSRGKFGEAQLEKLLENAGLIEGEHYVVQKSTSGEGTGRPDVTIAMPGSSVLFIDSKFPFDSFYRAYEVEDEAQRESLLKDHAKALKDHIKKLSERGYAQQDVSPDFVILFAPIESILADALRVDSTLLDYAFSQRVTIATPTNMMALLRTVAYLFSRDKVAKNASQIHSLAEKYLDDITKLYAQINKVGRAISSSASAYEELTRVAQNTAIRTAKKIRALDVQGPKVEEPVEVNQTLREIPISSEDIADADLVDE